MNLLNNVWPILGACVGFALVLVAITGVLGRRQLAGSGNRGGSGKFVGIVGRPGSGKSYMAVRMAWRMMKAGRNICTNFTMNLPPEMEHQWSQFKGWDDFAYLENAVVIIDEAHLLAPSNKTLSFPTVARWKLAQVRKFNLDVYWISQHEDRVNSIIKQMTELIYVCRKFSMFGTVFTAYGFEPEMLPKYRNGQKGKHIDRQSYRLDVGIAQRYNTLQIIDADDHLVRGDRSMRIAQEIGNKHNAKVGASSGRLTAAPLEVEGPRHRRCRHEMEANRRLGWCDECPAAA